jgi:hypothetical protein
MPPFPNVIIATILGILAALDQRVPPDPTANVNPNATGSLISAHAHNDYEHPDPCVGALDLGFASLEADVFAIDDRLLVGHAPDDLTPERTLESLYLRPILDRCLGADDPSRGPLPDGRQLTLLIDIKHDPDRTLDLLIDGLAPLRPWLTRVEGGRLVAGRIMVILSGYRPTARVAAMPDRPVFIDGRPGDLATAPPVELVPLISTSYPGTLGIVPIGTPSDAAIARITQLVDQAHAQGRRFRFWGHADDPRIWSALTEAGVDLIGTDDRSALASWLRSHAPGGDEATPVE